MKRKILLVLGATPFQIPIIKKAQKMDCYVISMDNVPGNPGHRYSDEGVDNISTTDYKKVLKFALEKRIDGIMTGGSDVAIPTIGYVCDKMNLPGITHNQGNILTRKDLFRDFQKKNGLRHPEYYVFSSLDDFIDKNKKLSGKYVLKPVDSSGSKGVSILNFPLNISSLKKKGCFEKALSFSLSKKVILEKHISGLECGGDAFLENGKFVSFQITNKYLTQPPYTVPIKHTIPSKQAEKIQSKIRKEIKKVVEVLGVSNGPVNFDIMIDVEEDIGILEMNARLGGNCIPQVIKYGTGFDEIEANIGLALNTGIDSVKNKASSFKSISAGARIIGSPCSGILKSITKRDYLRGRYGSWIKEIIYDYKIGEVINKFIQSNYRIGHFIVTADSLTEVEYVIRKIEKEIEIEV